MSRKYELLLTVYDCDDVDPDKLAEAVAAAVNYSTAHDAFEEALHTDVGLQLIRVVEKGGEADARP